MCSGRRELLLKHSAVIRLAVLGFSILSSALAHAELPVAADAHVTSSRPSVNFGSLSNLNVGNGSTALIQFDLSSLPAGLQPSQVGHATATLFVNRVNTPGVVNMAPVTSSWSEFGVTYSTLPSLGATSASFTASAAGQFVTLDITSLVQGWITSPASNFGIALTSSAANIQLDSKENDQTGHTPGVVVIIIVPGPAGPQGATGPQGPQGVPGPQGIPGVIGATGPAGPVGPAGATGSFTSVATWASATSYTQGQVVFCASTCATNGSSYYLNQATSTGNDPSTHNGPGQPWALIAQAGATGPAGPLGVPGPMGVPGPIGPFGPTGATGPAGPIGPAGPTGATGATGPAGPTGPTGATGSTGPVGPAGATGATGTFTSVVTWASATPYTQGQVVFCASTCATNGSSYYLNQATSTGDDPSTHNGPGQTWILIAQAGATGPAGATGATGPAGAVSSISVGSVTTGASGAVSITGTPANPAINVTFPTSSASGTVTSVTAGSVTTGGSTGSLSITNTTTTPAINVNFPVASIYGDGSDGTIINLCNIVSNTDWTAAPPSSEVRCTTFTLSSGTTLTVPSGTVIHATGTVNINGTIKVQPGGGQGLYINPPQPIQFGYFGGTALSYAAQSRILKPGAFGGGNGALYAVTSSTAALGGGSLAIYAAGQISVNGSITANGGDGAEDNGDGDGGGAGGIIILASKTEVQNNGSITANGGKGVNVNPGNHDASGGGGGGIIHLLAPSFTVGSLSVAGGAGGTGSGSNSFSGGGGGACGGNGGNGSDGSSAGFAGGTGHTFTTTITDPATVIMP